ncbi:MAG: hypothetical protein JST16_15715 [Bdellovibrionales bacterium]|nr:hypothetical protein [Bdellovibrionales bacterium]
MKTIKSAATLSLLVLAAACGGHGKSFTGTSSLAAGFDKGNGGDSVVCFKSLSMRNQVQETLLKNRYSNAPQDPFENPGALDDIESIRTLDLYEYQLPTGFPPQVHPLLSLSGDLPTRIRTVIDRAKTRTTLGDKIDETYSKIPLANWKASQAVVEIDDSNEAEILPANCLLIQQAVRQGNIVYYNAKLFHLLDDTSKTALVIHELVYEIAAERGSSTSTGARPIVGWLFSRDEFGETPLLALPSKLGVLGNYAFPYLVNGQKIWTRGVLDETKDGRFTRTLSIDATIEGFRVGAHTYRLFPSRLVLDADDRVLSFDGQLIGDGYDFRSERAEADSSSNFEFDPASGTLRSVRSWDSLPFNWKGQHYGDFVASVLFDAAENVKSTLLGNFMNNTNRVTVGGLTFVGVHGHLEYDASSGIVRSIEGCDPSFVKTLYGQIYLSGPLSFYPNGQLAVSGPIEQISIGVDGRIYVSSGPLRLPSNWLVSVAAGGVEWSPSGEIQAVNPRGEALVGPTSSGSIAEPTFYDVRRVEFYAGGFPKTVFLGGFGGYLMKDGSYLNGQRIIGPITIEMDAQGNVTGTHP